MKLKIVFDLGNDAFAPEPAFEVARILEEVRQKLCIYSLLALDGQKIRDINGNAVGYIALEQDQPNKE